MEAVEGDNLQPIDPEQRAAMEEAWRQELIKTEDEINTLKQVLTQKQQQATELKRKLGIKLWTEWKTGALTGVQNLKETAAFGAASESLKAVGEKTSSLFGSMGISSKLAGVKNSSVFKSVDEAVGSLKSKMTGTTSTTSFDDALNTMEQERAAQQKQEITQ